jgi:hypothetical protein
VVLKKILSGVIGGCAVIVTTLIVLSYQRTQNDIRSQLAEPEAVTPAADTSQSRWQLIYPLDLTGVSINPDVIAFDGENTVAILDRQQPALLTVNQETKNFAILPLPASAALPTAITYGAANLYLFAGAIWEYQTHEQTWLKLTPDLDFATPITLMDKFGDNFYLFGEQLIRRVNMDKHQQYLGLDGWLDEGETLDMTPVSVYVDGHIYASSANGQVQRFLRGEVTSWQPRVTLAAPVYLSGDDEDKLYFLSPTQETLFTVATNGELISQETDPKLAQAQQFWFASKTQTWYTLIGRQIFAATAEMATAPATE